MIYRVKNARQVNIALTTAPYDAKVVALALIKMKSVSQRANYAHQVNSKMDRCTLVILAIFRDLVFIQTTAFRKNRVEKVHTPIHQDLRNVSFARRENSCHTQQQRIVLTALRGSTSLR